MSFHIDDFDIEAEFEAELARVQLDPRVKSPGTELQEGGNSQHFRLSDSESDEDNTRNGEPASLQLLRAAVERRERAAEEFGRDWQRFCLEVAHMEPPSSATGPGASDTSPARLSEETDTLRGFQSNIFKTASTDRPGVLEPVTAGEALGQERQGLGSVIGAAPVASLSGKNLFALGKTSESKSQLLQQAEGVDLNAGVSQSCDASGGHLQHRGLVYECPDRTSSGGRHEDSSPPMWSTALALLEAERARVAAQREDEIAAAAAEQARLAAEAEATLRRLEQARRDAEERRALQEAAKAVLRQEALDQARRHMAARRIARAWRHYRQGTLRASRLAAVVRIQAAWRGHVDRCDAARQRAQRSILQDIEAGAREGKLEQLRSALHRAKELGLEEDVRMRLVALEAAADDAAATLKAAAARGNYLEFRTALAAAQAFPKLAPLIADSNALFKQRRADAEAAVWAAVADEPVASLNRLVESVAPLGIDSKRLIAALEAARQRDERIVADLEAASRAQTACFNAAEFEALMARAMRLGLKGDAAAARLLVDRRRRSLASALQRSGSSSFGAVECFRMAAEARQMGMIREAENLLQGLRSRQRDVQAALKRSVMEGSVSSVTTLLQAALKLHVPTRTLQDFGTLLRDRQSAYVRAFSDPAACSSLHGFLEARGSGVHSGVDLAALLAADRRLAAQQMSVVLSLAHAAETVRAALQELQPPNRDIAEMLAHMLRLGSARTVLRRATKWGADLTEGSMADSAASHANARAGAPDVGGIVVSVSNGCPKFHGSNEQRAQLDGIPDSDGAPSLSPSLNSAWASLTAAVRIGLSDAACLALCVLDLQHGVDFAAGCYSLRAATVERDYWGMLLPSAKLAAGNPVDQGSSAAVGVGCATPGSAACGHRTDGGGDGLRKTMVSLLQRHRGVSQLRPWAPTTKFQMLTAALPVKDSKTSLPAHIHQAAPPTSLRPGDMRPTCSEALLQAVIMRNAADASPKLEPADATCLPHVFRLDLGFERLTSLQGLKALCPNLRALSANANGLSSLEGLSGLSRLQELSAKHNQLTSLVTVRLEDGRPTPVLPPGCQLRQLALDSNKLAGQLTGLSGCSGLRSLSLAGNSLTDLGTDLGPCSSVLVTLLLRNNCLTSLHGRLERLTSLRDLDISGNRLTSLEGLQGLHLLQTLDANGNSVSVLPKALYFPYLTSLDLGKNSLTAFPKCNGSTIVLPSLQRLVLNENGISSFGPLGPMLHLTWLDVSFNNITSLDAFHGLSHFSGLRKLNISHNPVTDALLTGAGCPWPLGARASTCGAVRKGNGSALRAKSKPGWALPSLQELDYSGVDARQRLASALQVSTASPEHAISGIKQVRAAGACYVVHRTHVDAAATAGSRRQARAVSSRWPEAIGHCTREPKSRTGSFAASPADPVSVRSSLDTAVVSCTGRSAMCGLYVDFGLTVQAGLGRSRSSSRLHFALCGSAATCSAEESCRRAALEWLAGVRDLWLAGVPSENACHHAGQFVVMHGLGPQDASAHVGSADPAVALQLVKEHDFRGTYGSAAAGRLRHARADLLDVAALRPSIPCARAVKWPGAAQAASASLEAAATADGRPLQGAAGSTTSRCEESLRIETDERLQASVSDAGRRMLEGLGEALRLRDDGRASGPHIELSRDGRRFSRPSYIATRILKHASAAATVIQASWRGRDARRCILLLRAEASAARGSQQVAATTIQAWWRGHYVRKFLVALREDQQRRHLELCRREAAATTIQAYFRGHLIRKQLCAAIAAVRRPPGSSQDPDLLLMDSCELDDMLQRILSPVERLLLDDNVPRCRPAEAPSAELALSQARQVQTFNWQQPWSVDPRVRADDGHGASEEPQLNRAAPPSLPIAAGPQQGHMVGAQEVSRAGDGQNMEPWASAHGLTLSRNPLAVPQAATRLNAAPSSPAAHRYTGPSFATLNLQPLHPAEASPLCNPAGKLPPILVRGSLSPSAFDQGSARLTPQSLHADALLTPGFRDAGDNTRAFDAALACGNPGSRSLAAASPHEKEERQRRHLERLQKLMMEWGFKDLATAEAHYRRAVRHKQGNTRRKPLDKSHVQAQRSQAGKASDRQEVTAAQAASSSRTPSGPQHGTQPSASGRDDGLAPAMQRNLVSADSALANGCGQPVGDRLPQVTRSASQGGGDGFRSTHIAPLLSSGRHGLAPLSGAAPIILQRKPALTHRPHHLPALANNNWVLSPQLQIPPTPGAKGSLRVAGNALPVSARAYVPTNGDSAERPDTEQSLHSGAEVLFV